MTIEPPKVFWYAVTYAILVITTAFAYIGWSSQQVSLEVFNTKVDLFKKRAEVSGAIDEVEDAYKMIKAEREDLHKLSEQIAKQPPNYYPLATSPSPIDQMMISPPIVETPPAAPVPPVPEISPRVPSELAERVESLKTMQQQMRRAEP